MDPGTALRYGGPTPEEDERLKERAIREIEAELRLLEPDLRGISVTIEARHDHPADALVSASKQADVLVLGRHDPQLPLGSHLGPVVRAVLRAAHSPVLLIDTVPEDHAG